MIQIQLDVLTYLIHTCNSQCMVPDKYEKLIFCATNDRKSAENTKHVLIDLPNNFSKPCIERLKNQVWLHQSVRSATNFFLSKVTWIMFIQENIFRLGSMAMITFHHVKQGRLLHVGQCRIYNV